MASIGREGERGELKRILYRESGGKQKTLRLGECSERVAETARVAIEHLLIAKRHGSVPHADAVRWLDGIDDSLYARVAALGLCQPRSNASVVTVATLLDRFDATLTVGESTQVKYRQVLDSLREFLGGATPLATITPAHADNWRKWIAEPKRKDKSAPAKAPAKATIAKRVVIAKGVFRKAVRWGLIGANPFGDLRAGSQSNPDRAFFITRDAIHAILAACPDDEWRAIIALSRFAGLRCPSEIVGLRWGDVNWDRGRLTVRSPKTADHEGHAVRVVPIAPELRPILQDLFDAAEPGSEAMVPRLRDASVNLRTHFERIIAKAGIAPWPRLFHNLRASCLTDWAERFPAHAVAKWAGHSPMIAAQHYLQVRDTHFDLAAGVGQGSENPASNPASNPATQAASNAATRMRPRDPAETQNRQKPKENPALLVGCGTGRETAEFGQVPPEGLEPSTR